MHADLSNLWRFRTLVWLISQVPTLAVDPVCPLLQFFLLLWNYLSSSFGPHMDLSQSDFRMDYTPNGQEHEQHFASKKFDVFFIKIWQNWDSKSMQDFLWKGGSTFIFTSTYLTYLFPFFGLFRCTVLSGVEWPRDRAPHLKLLLVHADPVAVQHLAETLACLCHLGSLLFHNFTHFKSQQVPSLDSSAFDWPNVVRVWFGGFQRPPPT